MCKKIPDYFKVSRGNFQSFSKRGIGIGNLRSYPQNRLKANTSCSESCFLVRKSSRCSFSQKYRKNQGNWSVRSHPTAELSRLQRILLDVIGLNFRRKNLVVVTEAEKGVCIVHPKREEERTVPTCFAQSFVNLDTGDFDIGDVEFVLRHLGTKNDKSPVSVGWDEAFRIPSCVEAVFPMNEVVAKPSFDHSNEGQTLFG